MPAAWLDLLLLVMAANSAPILLACCLGNHLAHPIDSGRLFFDDRPLLGPSKTWRGLISAVAVTSLLAPVLGYAIVLGAAIGLCSMLGDLLSSFIKRRLSLPASARALLLDQLPEALLPAALFHSIFAIGWLEILYLGVAFFILELVLSMIFFRLGVRKQPY